MSNDIESYENNLELALFREYRDVIGLFKYVVETERRFYLCNHVDVSFFAFRSLCPRCYLQGRQRRGTQQA